MPTLQERINKYKSTLSKSEKENSLKIKQQNEKKRLEEERVNKIWLERGKEVKQFFNSGEFREACEYLWKYHSSLPRKKVPRKKLFGGHDYIDPGFPPFSLKYKMGRMTETSAHVYVVINGVTKKGLQISIDFQIDTNNLLETTVCIGTFHKDDSDAGYGIYFGQIPLDIFLENVAKTIAYDDINRLNDGVVGLHERYSYEPRWEQILDFVNGDVKK